MDINDIMGGGFDRPDHPDFWKLSQVVLKLDSGLDPTNPDEEEKDRQFKARLAEIGVDEKTLSYIATQRSFRALGIKSKADLLANFDKVALLAAIWIDAFAAGIFYERESS